MAPDRRRGVLVVLVLLLLTSACTASRPPPSTSPGAAAGRDADRLEDAGASDTYYLSPAGADEAPGTSEAPWRTFERALPALRPGDTLVVRDGVYEERVRGIELQPGTETEPIVVRAADGERPVIRGLLWLESPSYWVIDGINVTWDPARNSSDEHMVKLQNGVGWTWRNSELWGARSPAAVLIIGDRPGEPADWTLSDNCIHDTQPANGPAMDSNVYVGDMDSPGAGLIQRNLIFGAPNGRNIKLGAGDTTPHSGPAHVRVRYNTLVDAIVNVAIAGGAHDIVVERNILGRGSSDALVRGFELTGDRNVVRDNLGFGVDTFVAPEPGSLLIEGQNELLDHTPLSDLDSCDGFRPKRGEPDGYGRYG